MKYPALTKAEVSRLNRGRCADCTNQLVEGPSGGGSINHYCVDQKNCGSKFNLSLSWERISIAAPNAR